MFYKICFFVPPENAEDVKMSMFEAGAGKIGNYDCCSFESLGTGQFRPLEGSRPFIGNQNQIERVQELKVEMVCVPENIKKVVKALKLAHPYETPAYEVYSCEEF